MVEHGGRGGAVEEPLAPASFQAHTPMSDAARTALRAAGFWMLPLARAGVFPQGVCMHIIGPVVPLTTWRNDWPTECCRQQTVTVDCAC